MHGRMNGFLSDFLMQHRHPEKRLRAESVLPPVPAGLGFDWSQVRKLVWTLANAWPNKFSGNYPKAQGGEVVVDTLVISHEGLTIANARWRPESRLTRRRPRSSSSALTARRS
jgi:hypothetical protein